MTDLQKKLAIMASVLVVLSLSFIAISFLAYLHDQKVFEAGYQKAVNKYEAMLKLAKEEADKRASEIRQASTKQVESLQDRIRAEQTFSAELLKRSPKVVTIKREGHTVCTPNSSDTLDPSFINSYNSMGSGE